MSRIISSPSKYIQGKNELSKLRTYTSLLSNQNVYAIVDPFILNIYEAEINSSYEGHTNKIHIRKFNGECSRNEIDSIINDINEKKCTVVVGIGGGKTLDTAKAVAFYLDYPVVIVPTLASSDAPCSALSVIYTNDGIFDKYLPLRKNPDIVLVDTSVITNAPAKFLIAGIGDALATYFETRACYNSQSINSVGGICSLSALALAKRCFEVLLEDGLKAKYAVQSKSCSQAVENIIEANTYLSGIGFESGGLAAAHAVHNGLTVLKETHKMLHGEKVAFGTLVQLALENAPKAEIDTVINFCKEVGLPTTLHELGITDISAERIMKVAVASCAPDDTMKNMPFKVIPEEVFSAIMIAHNLGINHHSTC